MSMPPGGPRPPFDPQRYPGPPGGPIRPPGYPVMGPRPGQPGGQMVSKI